MIKGVLFDMDGVLVDSEAFICRAGIAMFAEMGYKVSEEDFKPFTGMGENMYLGGVAKKHGIPLTLKRLRQGLMQFMVRWLKAGYSHFPALWSLLADVVKKDSDLLLQQAPMKLR